NGSTYQSTTATTGTISFNGATVLTTDVDVTTANSDISFIGAGTIDGGFILRLTAGTGNIDFDGAVGANTPLSYLLLLSAGQLSNSDPGGEILLQYQDLYIDAPSSTITLQRNLTARRIVFYRGILDVNGQTLATDLQGAAVDAGEGAGDLAIFGTNYEPNDPDREGSHPGNILHSYPLAGAAVGNGGLTYFPAGGGYTAATGTFGTPPDAVLEDLDGSTLSVAGNLYVNGTDLSGAASWGIAVPDNSDADPRPGAKPGHYPGDAPHFGLPYAMVFNSSIDYGTASGGYISAVRAEIPYAGTADPREAPQGQNHARNNNVTFGSNNAGTWNDQPLRITEARTVADTIIRVVFNQPLSNSQGEVEAAFAGQEFYYTDAADPTEPGGSLGSLTFDQVYLAPGHSLGEPLNDALTTDPEPGHLVPLDYANPAHHQVGDGSKPLYLRVTNHTTSANRWKTDATGSGVSTPDFAEHQAAINGGAGAATSTDRSGNYSLDNIPNLFTIKGSLFSAEGKSPVVNYGFNQDPAAADIVSYDRTLDGAHPYLWKVEAARADHNKAQPSSIDAHNYLDLFYSEAVDIGDLKATENPSTGAGSPAAGAAETAAARNIRSQLAFTAASEHGGGLEVTDAQTITLTGLLSYANPGFDTAGANTQIGSRDALPGAAAPHPEPTANALYRDILTHTGTPPAAPELSSAQVDQTAAALDRARRLQIFLSSFDLQAGEGTFNDGTAAPGPAWPGWHYNLPDPRTPGTTLQVPANEFITDRAGNAVNHIISTAALAQNAAADSRPSHVIPAAQGPVAFSESATADTPGGTLPMDLDPPDFSVYSFDSDSGDPSVYEIVARSTLPSGLVDRIEFFIQDNSGENNESDWDPVSEDPGIPNHPDVSQTGYSYAAAPMRPLDGIPRGLRDGLFGFTGGDPSQFDGLANEAEAFRFDVLGAQPLVSQYSRSFDTSVNNSQFRPGETNTLINIADDPYFTISLDANAYSFGALTQIAAGYDHQEAYLTDLAGNLLFSRSDMQAIERTPPFIRLALAAVGSSNIYLQFNEPLQAIASDSTKATTPEGIADLLGDYFEFTSSAGFTNTVTGGIPAPDGPDQTDVAGTITQMYLQLAQPMTADMLLTGSLRLNSQGQARVVDRNSNPMLSGSEYSRRVSDLALGVISPVYASDGIQRDTGEGVPFEVLRDFSGSGTLSDRDILIQTSLSGTVARDLPTSLFYDALVPQEVTREGFWTPQGLTGLLPQANIQARRARQSASQGATRNFIIPGDDPEMVDGNVIEFILGVGDLNAGLVSDPDKPFQLDTWKFTVGGIITQRAGVTILNNVINPLAGDTTMVLYDLGRSGMVTVSVFTLDGNLVRVLHRGSQGTGSYSVSWNGSNTQGQVVARGLYLIRVVGPDIDEYRKVLVVKP
ncbi:FlgD immunoglobulin-like domain containing protein, partial [Spirochaeta lutea]